MPYCPECGNRMPDNETKCPHCTPAEEYNAFAQQDPGASGENNHLPVPVPAPKPASEATLSNGIKVLFVALNLLIPFVGIIFGMVLSLVFINHPSRDYKSYGKALLIMNLILIAIIVIFIAVIVTLIKDVFNDPGFNEFYSEWPYAEEFFNNLNNGEMI